MLPRDEVTEGLKKPCWIQYGGKSMVILDRSFPGVGGQGAKGKWESWKGSRQLLHHEAGL